MNSSSKIRAVMAILLAIIIVGLVGGYAAVKLHDRNRPEDTTSDTSSSQSGESETAKPNEQSTDGTSETAEPTEGEKSTEKPAEKPTQAQNVSNYAYAYAGFNPKLAVIDESQWNLLLVNRDFILPDNYSVKTVKTVKDIYGGYDRGYLDYRVAPHFIEMYNAALKDGLTLSPLSGYRSVTRQKNNFENLINEYIAKGYSKAQATVMASEIILPPSTSEHNAGIAMDILSLEVSFENSKEFAWLQEHAADYGFILRYPKDKQNITKITYEPWHWRYVGVKAAKEMKASGQCFEEYMGVR